jgi:type VI secretion system secreted protein Hcp
MAVDYFLKIDGIDGESQQSGHTKELEMDGWSFGETQSGVSSTATGSASGKVTLNEFRFAKRLDSASPKLQQANLNGKHIKWARFTARRAGSEGGVPVDYLFVDFGDLVISSYDVTGTGADGWPQETIAFSYGAIVMTYKQIVNGVAQGPIQGGYDAESNKKISQIPGVPPIQSSAAA